MAEGRVITTGSARVLIIVKDGEDVRRWDGRSGQPVGEAWQSLDGPIAVAKLPDGRTLLAISCYGVKRFDLDSGEELPTLLEEDEVFDVAAATRPDGGTTLLLELVPQSTAGTRLPGSP